MVYLSSLACIADMQIIVILAYIVHFEHHLVHVISYNASFSKYEITEIKKRLWNGSINIRIYLDINGQRVEYLVQAFRNSYLPMLYPPLISYLQNFCNERIQGPIWLEFENVPLRWNIPIGVLFDYLYLPAHASDRDHCWKLNLRINENYPVEYVMPFTHHDKESINYTKCLNEVLKNQLKQSIFVVNGSAKAIMQMSEQDSESYLFSIVSRNLNPYNNYNNKLIKSVKGIPIKILLPGSDSMSQVPARPTQTLTELMQETMHDLFGKLLNTQITFCI
ncbi:ATG5 [Candida margitis]|uniref:ATG5 n=1 Tax=Candida margitis TaxID=1775924 RepID=UPI002226976D|nr:ATG5 [Candida margitis]KAI5949672.1 ATG5 [Candida margitis]